MKAYSIFLLHQLAVENNIINGKIEYDTQWEQAEKLYGEFQKSVFNNPNNDEYECIDRFLTSRVGFLLIDDNSGEYGIYPANAKNGFIDFAYREFAGTLSDCFEYAVTKDYIVINLDEYVDKLKYISGTIMKDAVEKELFNLFTRIGMSIPENYEDIVQFIYEDILDNADVSKWNLNNVVNGFRRWIESE